MSDFVDEEVARLIARAGYESRSYIESMVPIEGRSEQFIAFCAGIIRYENVHLYENEKETMTEEELRKHCKNFGL